MIEGLDRPMIDPDDEISVPARVAGKSKHSVEMGGNSPIENNKKGHRSSFHSNQMTVMLKLKIYVYVHNSYGNQRPQSLQIFGPIPHPHAASHQVSAKHNIPSSAEQEPSFWPNIASLRGTHHSHRNHLFSTRCIHHIACA